jgi:molybdopterin molybdotransferase
MAGLTAIEDARRMILDRCSALEREPVPLERALGRALAEPLSASERVPAFDNSAMDGWAVRHSDIASAPATLRIVGESRAGQPFVGEVGEGAAVAISTGAVFPAGADTVVRVEDTSEPEPGRVEVSVAPEPGANVRHAGDDIEPGAALLEAGTRLAAAALGVLASVGAADPVCARLPRVALLSTGDELVGVGGELPFGGVRNSNAYALPGLVAAACAEVVSNERVPDDPEATRAGVARALEAADVLVACGGISVGPHDHVKGAFTACGAEEVFWRVSLKPGKPAWFGTAGQRLLFGLPGNPVSAFVTFLLFVRPALLALQGADPDRARIRAGLAVAHDKPADRAHAIRVTLEAGPRGWLATPAPHQGSHVMTSLLGADGLGLIPESATSLAAGEAIDVEPIPGRGPGEWGRG